MSDYWFVQHQTETHVPPTKAELAALRYLFGDKGERGRSHISGGSLIDYYSRRWDDAHESRPEWRGMHTSRRRHSWRRQGGTILGRCWRKGLLDIHAHSYGVPQYRLSEYGREWLAGERTEALDNEA